MNLGMQDQLHEEREKAGSAPEELHVLHGWETTLLPPPGYLLCGQMGDFYYTPPLDAMPPGTAAQVRGNRTQPFCKDL